MDLRRKQTHTHGHREHPWSPGGAAGGGMEREAGVSGRKLLQPGWVNGRALQ